MQSPEDKVDMAVMNAAIDRVLALPAPAKTPQKKKRTQRKAEHPPPAMSGKTAVKPAVR